MNRKTKKITTIGMLCAVAYVAMLVGRIPVILFLKYDPKDIIITIGGFMFGPLTAFTTSVIVSFAEVFTASETGIYGLIMNIISTCSFACTAAFIYKRKHNLKGAVAGLLCGLVCMVATMLLWNYIITPFYMGYTREAVAALLISAFLPFNLIKGGLNAAFTMLLYKPVVGALRRAHLVQHTEDDKGRRINVGIILSSLLVITTCILLVLSFNGII